jgi:hypothetical protein
VISRAGSWREGTGSVSKGRLPQATASRENNFISIEALRNPILLLRISLVKSPATGLNDKKCNETADKEHDVPQID